MGTVTLSVASREATTARAWSAFASVDLLWRVPTASASPSGALTIRAAARRVGRDVEADRGDVHALLDARLVDRTDDGRVVFPDEAVRVECDVVGA